jgi:hypothetical protein
MGIPEVTKELSHYVAEVKIIKVEKITLKEYSKAPSESRVVSTLTRINVSGKSISELTATISAHLSLVIDSGAVDV